MGLDITHFKGTLEEPKIINPFQTNSIIEEEFEGFNVPFEYFKPCIQKIKYPQTKRTLIIPKAIEFREEVTKLFGANYDISSAENVSLEKDYEVKNHLEGMHKHIWDTDKWKGIKYFELSIKTGFYFVEIAEQRKGINENFWKRFTSDTIYNFAKQEDFNYALDCVDYYWETDTKEEVIKRKAYFKDNFTDRYEYGKSWMNLSY